MTPRMVPLFAALIVSACSYVPPLPRPPSPPPMPAVLPVALAAPAAHVSPSFDIVQHYDAAKERVLAVVTLPAITVPQIERIRAADRAARAALTLLGRTQTRAALTAARAAVFALEAALTLEPPYDATGRESLYCAGAPSGVGPPR